MLIHLFSTFSKKRIELASPRFQGFPVLEYPFYTIVPIFDGVACLGILINYQHNIKSLPYCKYQTRVIIDLANFVCTVSTLSTSHPRPRRCSLHCLPPLLLRLLLMPLLVRSLHPRDEVACFQALRHHFRQGMGDG